MTEVEISKELKRDGLELLCRKHKELNAAWGKDGRQLAPIKESIKEVTGAVRRSGKRDLIERLTFAYALWLNRSEFPGLVHEFEEELGSESDGDQLRAILKIVVEYGGTPKNAKNLHSRDYNAVQYLLWKGVPPSKVAELASQDGQGAHAWSVAMAKIRREQNAGSGGSRPQKPARGYKIRIYPPVGKTVLVQLPASKDMNDYGRELTAHLIAKASEPLGKVSRQTAGSIRGGIQLADGAQRRLDEARKEVRARNGRYVTAAKPRGGPRQR